MSWNFQNKTDVTAAVMKIFKEATKISLSEGYQFINPKEKRLPILGVD